MLKLATVGTSWITSSFIEAAINTGKWELSAIYSRDASKAEALLSKHRAADGKAFSELDAVAAEKPDAVYIASPNSLHCPQSLFFLRSGINVIVEKPAVVSAAEWVETERTAKQYGAYIFEAFRHLASPGYAALREAVSRIGPVRNAVFGFHQYSSKYESFKRGESPNVFNTAFAGGAMNDIGVYPISLAAALWGMPKRILYSPVILAGGIDGAGSMILDYGGFMCGVSFSKIADGYAENEILGEDGGVVFDKPQELSRITLCERVKNTGPKLRLSDFGKNEAGRADVSVPMAENKMIYEAGLFADIINNRDHTEYDGLLRISAITHQIMDTARKQADLSTRRDN